MILTTRSMAAAFCVATLSAGSALAAELKGEIRDRTVMGVKAGMSLSAARVVAPEAGWLYEPKFMVDFSALCATKGAGDDAETLFCAIVPERGAEKGQDKIEAIAVFSAGFKTAEGVHAGMSVAYAAKTYGPATLSYNLENEGREYLSFAKAPKWMNFQASSDSATEGYAGLYAKSQAEGPSFQETNKFAEDAIIDTVWLY